MTCRELADFIHAYLAGELPSDVQRGFEAHLEICAACREYLRAYKATVDLGRRAFAADDRDASAADVPEDLVTAILNAASKAQRNGQ